MKRSIVVSRTSLTASCDMSHWLRNVEHYFGVMICFTETVFENEYYDCLAAFKVRITIAVGDKSYFPPLSGPRLNIARWLLYQTHRCSHSQTCQIPEWYQIHIQKKCIQYNILRNGWTRDYHVWSLPYTSVFVNDSGANLQMKLLGMYAILVNHWHVIYTMFRIIMRNCR